MDIDDVAETKGEDYMDIDDELINQKKMNAVEDERKRVKEIFAEEPRRSGRVGDLLSVKEEDEVNIIENEEEEDCFIIDPNSKDSLITDPSKLSISGNLDATDICVVAEKGQVACRDYPHSRQYCLKNPFEKTPHESHCERCYCFVCDKLAPCKEWLGDKGHCHATDRDQKWSYLRRERRDKPMNSSFVRMP